MGLLVTICVFLIIVILVGVIIGNRTGFINKLTVAHSGKYKCPMCQVDTLDCQYRITDYQDQLYNALAGRMAKCIRQGCPDFSSESLNEIARLAIIGKRFEEHEQR